jgi:hypothetical protein
MHARNIHVNLRTTFPHACVHMRRRIPALICTKYTCEPQNHVPPCVCVHMSRRITALISTHARHTCEPQNHVPPAPPDHPPLEEEDACMFDACGTVACLPAPSEEAPVAQKHRKLSARIVRCTYYTSSQGHKVTHYKVSLRCVCVCHYKVYVCVIIRCVCVSL